MFIVNRIFVHIFQVSHSLREGIAEFYGISGIVDPSFGWTVGVKTLDLTVEYVQFEAYI